LPVSVLAESAHNRLVAFAQTQARIRAEGWRVEMAEVKFDELLNGKPFRLDEGGPEIRGKIDRIDFHDTYGWRILDYKTSAKAHTPAEAHLRPVRNSDGPVPEYALAPPSDDGKKERAMRWTDLQLPLYKILFSTARSENRGQVQLAYFNLPQAVTETSLCVWEGYTLEMDKSAIACARGVLADIGASKFWPPAARVEFDDFETLLSPSPEEVVDGMAFSSSLLR
jgi:hypothetical protein